MRTWISYDLCVVFCVTRTIPPVIVQPLLEIPVIHKDML